MQKEIVFNKIVECLETTSYENPVTVENIAGWCGIEDGASCPKTRKLILELMEHRNIPIGSDHRGYYRINTAQEMQRYLNSLLRRQIAISKRIDVVYEAFHGRN